MENTELSDALSDYLALCVDSATRAPEQRLGPTQPLQVSANTTEFYALRTAYRDDHIARSATRRTSHDSRTRS